MLATIVSSIHIVHMTSFSLGGEDTIIQLRLPGLFKLDFLAAVSRLKPTFGSSLHFEPLSQAKSPLPAPLFTIAVVPYIGYGAQTKDGSLHCIGKEKRYRVAVGKKRRHEIRETSRGSRDVGDASTMRAPNITLAKVVHDSHFE